MKSLILSASTRFLLPLLLLFAMFLLIRGHNEPGGGFTAGLVSAAAFALYAFASGVDEARASMRINTLTMAGVGLLIAVASAFLPLFLGLPFFTILWWPYEVPIVGKIGTAFTFDLGVFLVVVGGTLTMIYTMADAERE